jgi:hypothetical protein
LRLLLGERLDDDPQGGRMNPRVGNRLQPFAELRIEIVKIAERAREEEVLADVAVRPLDPRVRLRRPEGRLLPLVLAR